MSKYQEIKYMPDVKNSFLFGLIVNLLIAILLITALEIAVNHHQFNSIQELYYYYFGLALVMLNLLFIQHLLKEAFRNQKFIITDDYIIFPHRFAHQLFFRQKRNFNDIARVVIGSLVTQKQKKVYDVELQNEDKNNLIIVYFKSGGKVTVNLKYMNKEDSNTFISCFNQFFDFSYNSPAKHTSKSSVALNSPANMSFTQMWQTELENHFTSTNYMPLTPNQYLLDKRYQIVIPISVRPFTSVYLAQTLAKEQIIIKEFYLGFIEAKQEKLFELFDRQAQILLKLNHPQISRVIDSFTVEDKKYLVLEYKTGKTLRKLIQENIILSNQVILDIGFQLAAILQYLHSQEPPVVHRDITPDNIVLNNQNKCFLIDFGAASHYLADVTGTIIGKQGYMPPEQIKGKATIQSDIYALGATLYYLICHEDPIVLEQASPKRIKHNLAIGINKLIEDSTSLDVNKRIANSAELMAQIKLLQQK